MNVATNARLKLLYIAAFLQAFNLWYAVEKLFMRGIGFDDAAIALAVTLFTIVTVLVETPSGILADRWSRKGVLILSNCALIMCTILGGFSSNVASYTVALLFLGVYFALYSGTYEAVVYDVLVEDNGDGQGFEKYYGKLQALSSVALVSGSLLSGVLSHYLGLRAVYFLTIPLSIMSIMALLLFREPVLHRTAAAISLGKQIRATFQSLGRNHEVRWLVLSLILLSVSTSLIFEFNQLWYVALAIPIVLLGPANALVQSCLGIGSLISSRIRQQPAILAAIGLLLIGSAAGLTLRSASLVVVSQVILQSGLVALTIIMAKRLHDTLPSSNRAGVVSAVSTLSKISFAPLALLFGVLSRNHEIFQAALLLVILTIILLLVILKTSQRPRAAKT